MNSHTIVAQWVDIMTENISPVRLEVRDGRIYSIERVERAPQIYLCPGFVDAHIHVESSMLVPSEFAKLAVRHGTVATVSDPHEIANVLGVRGVDFMLEDAAQSPLKIFFGAPSCVPATAFETAGARLGVEEVRELLARPQIHYLAEMMNWPGAIHGDPEVLAKIEAAKAAGKPVDGHAPGLKGADALAYIGRGITTDHECYTEEEARFKLQNGMKVIIREGSAARNFEALIPLLDEFPHQIMFCSDDKHPDELLQGHINQLAARAAAKVDDVFKALRAACVNPVRHYGLPVGLLRPGDPADFVLLKDIKTLEVFQTYIDGQLVAEEGRELFRTSPPLPENYFEAQPRRPEDFRVANPGGMVRVIEAIDSELVTRQVPVRAWSSGPWLEADPARDLLKIAVVNRYRDRPVAAGFVLNFGLRQGAIASTVAHDSHNIIAVGADDASICQAVNLLVESRGGLAAVSPLGQRVLPLPVAGLMSTLPGDKVAAEYTQIHMMAREMGSRLRSPFMTLSFMALLVIPDLKISDLGLFDGQSFSLVGLAVPAPGDPPKQ